MSDQADRTKLRSLLDDLEMCIRNSLELRGYAKQNIVFHFKENNISTVEGFPKLCFFIENVEYHDASQGLGVFNYIDLKQTILYLWFDTSKRRKKMRCSDILGRNGKVYDIELNTFCDWFCNQFDIAFQTWEKSQLSIRPVDGAKSREPDSSSSFLHKRTRGSGQGSNHLSEDIISTEEEGGDHEDRISNLERQVNTLQRHVALLNSIIRP